MQPILRHREEAEAAEDQLLAPFALRAAHSVGRRHAEPEDPHRTAFARDRDRVVHSGAFRRLEYKTQVLTSGTGDNYRTRLTHTLEVAQVARSLAQALRLNETFVECLALVHDLGHPPFGHSGEQELRELMQDAGGFEHNVQALRVVDLLENPYPGFPGLNLTREVRESILKHGPGAAGALADGFPRLPQPWLEAQLVDLSDSLAYYTHDLDDGLRFGVLQVSELDDLELWQRAREAALRALPEAAGKTRPVLQQTLKVSIHDLLQESARRLAEAARPDALAARQAPRRLLSFSADMQRMQSELRAFLFRRFYRADEVEVARQTGRQKLRELFHHLREHPADLPAWARQRHAQGEGLPRIACDYVAGMTDRFALLEHERLLDG